MTETREYVCGDCGVTFAAGVKAHPLRCHKCSRLANNRKCNERKRQRRASAAKVGEVSGPPEIGCACPAAAKYYQVYYAHIGQESPYHFQRVRWARELIRIHEKDCPICRGDGARTNYNLTLPNILTHRAPRNSALEAV